MAKNDDEDRAAWGADYDNASGTKKSYKPSPQPSAEPSTLSGSFLYIDHKTIRSGRLLLEFQHIETGEIACRFFNVDIQNPRTGRKYRVGEHGQFTTQPRHKFRQYWLYVIGSQPRSWSRVHQEMYQLKDYKYGCLATHRNTKNGGYWNLDKIRKL